MRKKDLEKLPAESVCFDSEKKYVIMVQKTEIKEEDYLVVDIYIKKDKGLAYRLCLSDTDYGLYDFMRKSWFKSNPFYQYSLCRYTEHTLQIRESEIRIDKKSKKTLVDFVKKSISRKLYDPTISDYIEKIIDKVKLQKSLAKARKENELKESLMEKVCEGKEEEEKLLKKVDKWIAEEVMTENFIFYRTKSKKIAQVYTTCCGTHGEIERQKEWVVHNTKGVCPFCKAPVEYKAEGLRSRIGKYKDVAFLQKIEDGFVLRVFKVKRVVGSDLKSQEGFREISKREMIRDFYIDKKRYSYYLYKKIGGNEVSWHKSHFGMSDFNAWNQMLYPDNAFEVISEDEEYQYSCIDMMAKDKEDLNYRRYLNIYRENKYMEKLYKAGLKKIFREVVDLGQRGYINERKQELSKMLSINKSQLKQLIRLDGSGDVLSWIKFFGENPVDDDLLEAWVEYLGHTWRVGQYAALTSKNARKILNYLESQGDPSSEYGIYDDYLKFAKALGYDLSKKEIAYPQNLRREHDIASKLYEENKPQLLESKYRSIKKKLSEFTFESKHLEIIVPQALLDIKKEGQTLHHCVGTYIDKVVDEKTSILFIRKKAEKEKPYYTMEVKDFKIIQVRGLKNCIMTKEVKAFVERYKKKLEKMLKQADRKKKVQDLDSQVMMAAV